MADFAGCNYFAAARNLSLGRSVKEDKDLMEFRAKKDDARLAQGHASIRR